MKKLILFAFLVVGFTACNRTSKETTETAAAKTTGPAITFKETSYDFGEMDEGDIVEHDFEFTNTGNAPLEIVDVMVQCGCTVASRPENPIGVGQTDKITVRFNSKGKPGVNNKFVTIAANTEVQPEAITFKATVNQAIK